MQRGEIWWARLPEPAGSEPGFDRPVLIVQHDAFTRSRLGTVLGVALTRTLRLAQAPGNVLLPASATGLPADSVANVTQVVTLDKARLVEQAGAVPPALLRQVEEGLRLVLGV